MTRNLNVGNVHMKKYTISVDLLIEAHSALSAQQKAWDFMKKCQYDMLEFDVTDWDLSEFGQNLLDNEDGDDNEGYC